MKPTETPQVFRTTGQTEGVTLMPLYRLFDTRYSVYFRVT
jgi:hypothetical protein